MRVNDILFMDGIGLKQTCAKLIKINSSLAYINQIMKASDIFFMDGMKCKQACIQINNLDSKLKLIQIMKYRNMLYSCVRLIESVKKLNE